MNLGGYEHDEVGSPLRSLMAAAAGTEYRAYASWGEGRSDPDAAIVISGDDGGTIYLTVPLRLVRCDGAAVAQLALDLDAVVWKDLSALEVTVEHLPVGSGVSGGMGGGIVVNDVWLHPREFNSTLRRHARRVLLSAPAEDHED